MVIIKKQFHECGIDLSDEFKELEDELHITPLPNHMLSEGTQKMRWAARELGHEMLNMPKQPQKHLQLLAKM